MSTGAPPSRSTRFPPGRIPRLAGRAVRPFVIAYVAVVAIAMALETRLIYPAPGPERGDWGQTDPPHEDVWFASADGTRLNGWFFHNPAARRAILYCHGNGVNVALTADLAALLANRLAASVLTFDYRGYGRSEGSPSEAGCIADAQAARDWLAKRVGAPKHDIVLVGHSLGGGVASALAADGGARALILENTFSSIVDVAAQSHWWLPVRWVMRNRYDSVGRIQRFHGPLLQCHGTADTLVPIDFARRLFAACPSNHKEFIEGQGLGHDDGPPDGYYRRLAAFLDEVDAGAAVHPPNG